jgi:hypothetical protein
MFNDTPPLDLAPRPWWSVAALLLCFATASLAAELPSSTNHTVYEAGLAHLNDGDNGAAIVQLRHAGS